MDPYEAKKCISTKFIKNYSVKNSYSGDNFYHHEMKIDVSTMGGYRVLLTHDHSLDVFCLYMPSVSEQNSKICIFLLMNKNLYAVKILFMKELL